MLRLHYIIILTALLSACTVLPPATNDRANIVLPDSFSMYSEEAELTKPWWESFNSPQLNNLISEATNENFSIKEALARLEQARFSFAKTKSSQTPTLDYSASGSYQTQKLKDMTRIENDNWSLGLTASYELDLWGRIEAERTSSAITAQASHEDVKTALMTVTGSIAENWATLISLNNQQALFLDQLELQKQLLQLIKLRFPAGQASALDIYQQQQAIERISTALIPINSRQKSIKRQLAFLSGKITLKENLTTPKSLPAIDTLPTLGIPADLIAARPDVRAAGLRLKSSQWAVTAAQADRLPALKLTASQSHSSAKFTDILDNWLLNLAANLTGPIFDGNRRKLEVARTKAVADERLEIYRKTVFSALKEVEDALADENQYSQTVSSLKKQLLLSEKTMREAKNRYLNGSTDFLNVLREELNNLQIRQDIILSKEKMVIARIHLHKALGGAWLDEIGL